MIYHFDGYVLDTDLYHLRRNGEPVYVRRKVFEVLKYLLENQHRVVSKDELCKFVWHGRFISNSTIESTVLAARRALGDTGETKTVIRTIPCYGYRIVVSIKHLPALGGKNVALGEKEALIQSTLPAVQGNTANIKRTSV
ncbi:MAG: winged helix-turn-helix domain-containing protein [Gammaproteobacteria bacterium]